MAEAKHPYIPSKGMLIQLVNQFRKSFPAKIDAKVLKKLGIGSNNESVLLAAIRFLDLIDDSGKKTSSATAIFSKHDNEEFEKALGEQVKKSYAGLFELFGEDAWTMDVDGLIGFFRNTDQTSAITGKRQANCFEALSALCGHADLPTSSKPTTATKKQAKPKTPRKSKSPATPATDLVDGSSPVGLTVRIEVNLPASGDQQTYDRIFKSIRENLLNG